MRIVLCNTLKNYNKKYLPKDLIAGIIIAAISVPTSIGYAQISGLPAVYGLYGSVFPIIIFALFSTSPQFIFGVDAAPAALVGASLLSLGVTTGSEEAIRIVPVITLFTALWLFLFFFLGAGKLVNYISTPVIGGFVSGICCTVILMQIPKVLGSSSGTGELLELIGHLINAILNLNVPSLILGLSAFIILRLSKRLMPKFPMFVLVMILGALLTVFFHIDDYGIVLLSSVEPGLPRFIFPDITSVDIIDLLGISLTIALVIMSETLLAENSLAIKNGYQLNDNQEILAFACGNLIAAFTGCCPINGSVSRSVTGEQYGAKTQLTSIVAGVVMIFVLLFCTGFIGYFPIPVLTAIVISGLIGACEFKLARKLWKVSRGEFYIFCGVFLGVLVLGRVYGVMVGVLLSFVSVIRRAADPPRSFLGVLPGHNELFDMSRFGFIYPIQNVVVYRFSGNLFFANVSVFQRDIEDCIKDDTKAVIVDAGGIVSLDVTAAERIVLIYNSLKEKGIRFFITEHIAALNEQMRSLGIGWLIENGTIRKTIEIALMDMDIRKPYPLEGADNKSHSVIRRNAQSSVHEFVWAFGDDAESQIEKQIHKQIELLEKTNDWNMLEHGMWNQMDPMDEEDWLNHLEAHLSEIVKISDEDEEIIADKIKSRRKEVFLKIKKEHPELAEKFKERENIQI